LELNSVNNVFKKTGYEYVDQINLAKDRVQWWDLVNRITKLSGSVTGGEFLEKMSAC
jgi:hypothetical protein